MYIQASYDGLKTQYQVRIKNIYTQK